MPLHDWSKPAHQWGEMHLYWLVALADQLRPILPAGYRPHVGVLPALTIAPADAEPDVGVVRDRLFDYPMSSGFEPTADELEPDFVATVAVEVAPAKSLLVEHEGVLVAVIELVSPRNKDRVQDGQQAYGAKYLGYLHQLVNLMLVDVLPRPAGFSFVDLIADRWRLPDRTPMPAPVAASYRIDGRIAKERPELTVWRRRLTAGQPLPALPLGLNATQSVSVDLEASYMVAAAKSYLT